MAVIDQIDDPRDISQKDMPLIVLSNQSNSIVAWAINWRTSSNYDHAMLCINQGEFVTQGLTYKSVPMKDYLIKGGQLKFVQLVNINDAFTQAFRASVSARLAAKWWHKIYDFPGIVGYAIGLPWIHTPGLEYCSVDVIRHIKNACGALPIHDQEVIMAIPNESSPMDLDNIIKNHPEIFKIYGIWSADIGITV